MNQIYVATITVKDGEKDPSAEALKALRDMIETNAVNCIGQIDECDLERVN